MCSEEAKLIYLRENVALKRKYEMNLKVKKMLHKWEGQRK